MAPTFYYRIPETVWVASMTDIARIGQWLVSMERTYS